MNEIQPASHGVSLPSPGAQARCYWHHGLKDFTATKNILDHTGADIIVIGGGFAGLATACRIAERQPDAKIVLLEAKAVGYGASGRNGGLVSPLAAPIWLAGALRDRRQSDALRLLYHKTHAAAEWAQLHAPEAEVQRRNLLIAAQGPLTSAGLSEVADVVVKAGIPVERGPVEREHTRGQPGTLQLTSFTIHPYKLALGLAMYARRLGVDIIEDSPVRSIAAARGGAVVTLASGQSLVAEKIVVSTNAYSGSIAIGSKHPGKVVRNFMVATGPLSDAQLASVQNNDSFVVELNRKYIFYRLHDRRLVFGGIDKIGMSNSPDDFDIPIKVAQSLRRELSSRVIGGSELPIDFGWGGRFHMTTTDLPVIAPCTANPAIIYNVGYGGTGVALTLALAPVAAALALDQKVDDSETAHLAAVMRETRLPVLAGITLAARVTRQLFSQALARTD